MKEFSFSEPEILEVSDSISFGSKRYPAFGKRLIDILIACFALVAALPILVILVGIVSMSGGAAIYSQVRIGQGGRPFRCYKIRSMALNAEEYLQELLSNDPIASAEWAEHQKLSNDPRVTRFGHFLRKTSLDELPQLWNVLRGDMSIVGPRPVVEAELARYGAAAGHYKSVRPGLTGPWQVSGRNSLSYSERVALDEGYVRQISLLQDLIIIFMTFRSVVLRTGQ